MQRIALIFVLRIKRALHCVDSLRFPVIRVCQSNRYAPIADSWRDPNGFDHIWDNWTSPFYWATVSVGTGPNHTRTDS